MLSSMILLKPCVLTWYVLHKKDKTKKKKSPTPKTAPKISPNLVTGINDLILALFSCAAVRPLSLIGSRRRQSSINTLKLLFSVLFWGKLAALSVSTLLIWYVAQTKKRERERESRLMSGDRLLNSKVCRTSPRDAFDVPTKCSVSSARS